MNAPPKKRDYDNSRLAPMLEHALRYAKAGRPVFPCKSSDKTPYTEHGFHDASTDVSQIERWWTEWPDAMIGMPTGKVSGVAVLDVDIEANATGALVKDGRKSLEAVRPGVLATLPDTVFAKTPRGGNHYWFLYEDGFKSRNSIVKDVDLKADGGYVIVPPSRRSDGSVYKFEYPEGLFEIAAAPEWLAYGFRHKNFQTASDREDPAAAEYASQQQRNRSSSSSQPGGDYFRNVNSAALANLDCWVRELFPTAKFQPGTKAWRVSSKDLGRDYEEDLSIHPTGIRDWGPEKGVTAIDLVMDFGGAANALQAADWLCEKCGIDPATLGRRDRGSKHKERSGAEASSNAEGTPSGAALWDPWAEPFAPMFPMETLPDAMARYIDARGTETGACRSAIAMACLATASGALTHEARLYLKPGKNFAVSPRLWVVLVGNPSAKKSPAIDGAVKPLLKHQKTLQAAQWESWRQQQELDEDSKKESGPDLTHFVLSDLTPEALADVLSRQNRGVLLSADELAGWLGAHDRYGAGKGAAAARAIWLTAYNGGYYNLMRIGRRTVPVENLSASIIGGIQPERLRELGSLTSDGLLQRFLPVWMRKPVLDSNKFDTEAWRHWDGIVRSLLEFGAFSTELTPEAQKERERIAELLFDLGQIESEGAAWQGFVGKLAGVWGSLALLLHALWGYRAADRVDEATAKRASRIVEDFVLPHGLAFYRHLVGSADQDNKLIAGWLASWEGQQLKVRDVKMGPRCCRSLTPDEINKRLQPFEAGGWLEPAQPGPWNRQWTVAPGLGERFGAQLERYRAAIALIQEKIRGADEDE